jgi:hypothetical protein
MTGSAELAGHGAAMFNRSLLLLPVSAAMQSSAGLDEDDEDELPVSGKGDNGFSPRRDDHFLVTASGS